MINRTGDGRQHSFPIHQQDLIEPTAWEQSPHRPANRSILVGLSFLTIRAGFSTLSSDPSVYGTYGASFAQTSGSRSSSPAGWVAAPIAADGFRNDSSPTGC